MTENKRLTIVSFFAAITLSGLCNGFFSLFEQSICSDLKWYPVLYMISFLIFLIKYYLDDIFSNKDLPDARAKSEIALLVVGWTFFLFAAISAKDVFLSSLGWLAGIIVLNIFLYKNKVNENNFCIYLIQNGVLIFLLIPVALFHLSESRIVNQLSPCNLCQCDSGKCCTLICLLIFNVIIFMCSLQDKQCISCNVSSKKMIPRAQDPD